MIGSKSKYTTKQKRQASHIAKGYKRKGLSARKSKQYAWATVNKETGGGLRTTKRKVVGRSATVSRKVKPRKLITGKIGSTSKTRLKGRSLSSRKTTSRVSLGSRPRSTSARKKSGTSLRLSGSVRRGTSRRARSLTARKSTVGRRSISLRKKTGLRSASSRRSNLNVSRRSVSQRKSVPRRSTTSHRRGGMRGLMATFRRLGHR